MTLLSRRLAPAFVVLTLTMGLPLGCGTPNPMGDGDGSSGETSSTGGPGPTTTTLTSADTTAGPTSQTDDSTTVLPGTSSSSGDPDTTEGVSVSESSGTTDGTTSDGTTDTGTTDTGSTGAGVLPDISGEFLLALATPLDASLPLQYIATFDFVAAGMGGSVDVELQPLALDQASTTTPRTFFGPPIVLAGLPVAPDGSFVIDVGNLFVAAETNPIIFANAQANTVVLDAQILDVDGVCGTVTGNLTFPVMASLAGSTFAAVRVADTLPASLPVVFPSACP